MPKKHNLRQDVKQIEDAQMIDEQRRLKDLNRTIDLFQSNLHKEQIRLEEIDTPLGFMRKRAETAESNLKASDIALTALKVLQNNSAEAIHKAYSVIASLKATIKENEGDLDSKQRALADLNKLIEENKAGLQASALAFAAVNQLALNDALTGLPNRRLLSDRLKQMIISNQRSNSNSAAIFLDLDKFKKLNDEFGHEAGDSLLIAVGQRLTSCVRESDTVARYGGDEFVILLNQLDGNLANARCDAEKIANKILTALNLPYKLKIRDEQNAAKTIEYQCFASLGVVIFDGDLSKELKILDWADEAMYWAKSEGGRTIRFYDDKDSTEQTLTKLYELATENDIETANHGIRMRQYVKTLAHRAQQMNLYPNQLNDQVIERLFKTTQLHDIGKSKIPYAILHKERKLTPEEWSLIQTHTTEGKKILEAAKKQNENLNDLLDTAIDIAIAHHEYWNGAGYPLGLVGDAIPLAGQITGIADVYDALISSRSYKTPWTHADACVEIISKSGTQFNPLLIEAFKREADHFALIAEGSKD